MYNTTNAWKSKYFFLAGLLFIQFGFTACKKEVRTETGLGKGVMVVNEGPFMTGTGTLTWIGENEDTPVTDAFERANPGVFLGNIAQSATANANHLFIAVNNASRIVVASRVDLRFAYEIPNIPQVRYVAVAGDSLLYASYWGDGFSGGFRLMDPGTGVDRARIEALPGPEEFALHKGKVYIPLSGGFGHDSRVLVLSALEGSVSDTLPAGDRPTKCLSTGEDLFLLCGGKFDFSDPSKNTEGALMKLEENGWNTLTPLPNGAKCLTWLPATASLYFLSGNQLGAYHIPSGQLKYIPLEGITPYALYSAEWKGAEHLWVTDAGDFASRGVVRVINSEGQVMAGYDAGIVPSYVLDLD
jgi:hypothetical protein